MIQQTLAALTIEIILKSYNSIVADNAGEINESYQFKAPEEAPKIKSAHDLAALAGIPRKDIYQYLIEPSDEKQSMTIEIHLPIQNTFTNPQRRNPRLMQQ